MNKRATYGPNWVDVVVALAFTTLCLLALSACATLGLIKSPGGRSAILRSPEIREIIGEKDLQMVKRKWCKLSPTVRLIARIELDALPEFDASVLPEKCV